MTDISRERLARIDRRITQVERLLDGTPDPRPIPGAPWRFALGGVMAGIAVFAAGIVFAETFIH